MSIQVWTLVLLNIKGWRGQKSSLEFIWRVRKGSSLILNETPWSPAGGQERNSWTVYPPSYPGNYRKGSIEQKGKEKVRKMVSHCHHCYNSEFSLGLCSMNGSRILEPLIKAPGSRLITFPKAWRQILCEEIPFLFGELLRCFRQWTVYCQK